MSVFKTAYDTTACRDFNMSKVVNALAKARLQEYIRPEDGHPNIFVITRDRHLNELVPPFAHPVEAEVNGVPTIFVDAREYGKMDAKSFEFVITNSDAYKAMMIRASLQENWSNDRRNAIRTLKVPIVAYTSILADVLGARKDLNPGEQATIAIAAGVFYLSLFADAPPDEQSEKSAIVTQVARATGIKNADVYDFVQKVNYIENIDEFCEVVKEHVGNIRLSDLNPSTLITLLGGIWYGSNAEELVAVALEHPPTWVTMLYQAYTARSFGYSRLAKMLERSQFRRDRDQFVFALGDIN